MNCELKGDRYYGFVSGFVVGGVVETAGVAGAAGVVSVGFDSLAPFL